MSVFYNTPETEGIPITRAALFLVLSYNNSEHQNYFLIRDLRLPSEQLKVDMRR